VDLRDGGRVAEHLRANAMREVHTQRIGLPTGMSVVPDDVLMPIRPEPDEDQLPATVPAKQQTTEEC